jgi:hypothetical protein
MWIHARFICRCDTGFTTEFTPIIQVDRLGLSGGRIQANNKAVVFHPLSLNSPTRSAGF